MLTHCTAHHWLLLLQRLWTIFYYFECQWKSKIDGFAFGRNHNIDRTFIVPMSARRIHSFLKMFAVFDTSCYSYIHRITKIVSFTKCGLTNIKYSISFGVLLLIGTHFRWEFSQSLRSFVFFLYHSNSLRDFPKAKKKTNLATIECPFKSE